METCGWLEKQLQRQESGARARAPCDPSLVDVRVRSQGDRRWASSDLGPSRYISFQRLRDPVEVGVRCQELESARMRGKRVCSRMKALSRRTELLDRGMPALSADHLALATRFGREPGPRVEGGLTLANSPMSGSEPRCSLAAPSDDLRSSSLREG